MQELLIDFAGRVTRSCPIVPEDKERESVYRNLSDPEEQRDQEQHRVGEHHPVLEAALPALCVRDLPAPGA